MSEASKMISMEQHCKDLGELEQIISELRRALDNANAASVERHYRAAQPVEIRSRCCDAISQKNVCAKCGMVCFEWAAQPPETRCAICLKPMDDPQKHWRECMGPARAAQPESTPPTHYQDTGEHTCDTPNYTDGPCYACAKDKVMEWVFERYENCQRIAKTKSGEDQKSWLEDADYFMFILCLLRGRVAGAAQPESTPPTDLKRHLDQALRQWRMYANDNDSRELKSCPSAEGEMYREAKKALAGAAQTPGETCQPDLEKAIRETYAYRPERELPDDVPEKTKKFIEEHMQPDCGCGHSPAP